MYRENGSGRHDGGVPAVFNREIPFPDELEHLESVYRILEKALCEADSDVERRDTEYRAHKRYMSEYRGEIDPHEMFQNELALKDMDRSGAFSVGVRDKLAKLKESPYFARIDFQEDGRPEARKCYIGRFGLAHENAMLVFDWRAPVSAMFYDCELGPACYDAPMGRIDGTLLRKRQFKIKGSVMEYALETSANIQDDVLQRELSQTSDEKMKSIINTLQKEQNKIIRSEQSGTLIIQGVAGSGKTSIALHRIAFLLYRYKDTLSAGNVAILSPNQVFGDYISSVLPELGEEPIFELSFTDIAEIQLEGLIDFQPEQDPLECPDGSWAERVRDKSTLSFVRELDRFIASLPQRVFQPADYVFGGFTASAGMIQSRFDAYSKYPIKRRLQMIADDIHDRFHADNDMEEDLPRAKTILKGLSGMLNIKSTLALYQTFYQQRGRPDLFVMPSKKTLEWADVSPVLYLHAAFEGLKTGGAIRHLVVDEMQDYTPVQYAVLNLLFPCQKTILGDFGQFIDPNRLHTLEDLRELYSDAQYVELNKSYRSTYEIIDFAKRLNPANDPEPMERHGDRPVMRQCGDAQEELAQIETMIRAFAQSGRASLGIIAKTNRGARLLFDRLAQRHEITLLSPESKRFINGVSVTSVQMSKGLEFDEVIIADADHENYATEHDHRLLYVACTRAMHSLTLLYTGTSAFSEHT